MLMATVKPGGPIEPASGPAKVRRSPAGADDTTSRTGAAVGSGPGRLAQQEHGPPGIPGAAMQPPRRREVQPRGVAADFEEHRREPLQPRGFLGDPQRIRKLRRLRDHAAGRGRCS